MMMQKTTPEHVAGSGKSLIIYFSHSGNTREIARKIQQQTGGDIMEIQPADPYPDNYGAVVRQARADLDSGYKPPLKTTIESIESYDVIYLGSPNWLNTIAPPVQSFLSQFDLAGKTIAPFITHGGGGSGGCVADIAALCPDSTILNPLVVRGGSPGKNAVRDWLAKLGLKPE